MSTSHAANTITSTMMTNWNLHLVGETMQDSIVLFLMFLPGVKLQVNQLQYPALELPMLSKPQELKIIGITTLKGTTPDVEQALFEVKNKDNQTIFAVYNEGVRIWVADGAKGTKGGFAVEGFDMKTDYMVIKPDSANFYVRETTKDVASSFNIIGVKQNLARKPLMFARTDTVGVSGVMNIGNNLLVQGNINISGTIIIMFPIWMEIPIILL